MSQSYKNRNTWTLCNYGGAIKRWTSWTDSNHGRRFEVCENNRKNRGKGHYWEWVDEEICPRGKEVLPGLLRRMRAMELELNQIEEDNEGLKDKLRVIEQENKELTATVGRLGRQRMKMDEKIMVYRHIGKLMFGGKVWSVCGMGSWSHGWNVDD
ncbi:hypothetical protein PRUPE_5G194900 [Prunus persica]|uniref:GRF-type domain-containing protein n=1 Tax=Prunus persica TaxID=3760 RepID=A0A251PAT9_PRUPE|nr:uncharacterized protein LOC109949297 [Prunus persica]ONI08697.1 hypothetical protein PRUPE_5G194900 [Prunus persica]